MECLATVNCVHCSYKGISNIEYLKHKREDCVLSILCCEYCNMEMMRLDLNYHYNICKFLFQCEKCRNIYHTSVKELHQICC